MLSPDGVTPIVGGVQPGDLVRKLIEFGYSAATINDYGTFLGSIRGALNARLHGLDFYLSTRVSIVELPGLEFILFPLNARGYSQLTRLVSRLKIKGRLTLRSFLRLGPDDVAVVVLVRHQSKVEMSTLREIFTRFKFKYCARLPHCELMESRIAEELANYFRIPQVATLNPGFFTPADLAVADCLTAIKLRKKVKELQPNERFSYFGKFEPLKVFRSMFPASILERNSELKQLLPRNLIEMVRQNFPRFSSDDHALLKTICEEQFLSKRLGLKERSMLEKELRIIRELGYERFFLVCHDLVRFAKSAGILCQGRGAAANSVVCYLLGITNVHPSEIDFLFERFINKERDEPPDIDIDFESDRRQEIFDYIFQKYRGRCALTSSVITFQLKNSVRDVGRVLNIPPELLNKLARKISYWTPENLTADLVKRECEVTESFAKRWVELACLLQDCPRHLSQHVGGVLFHGGKIWELAPVFYSNDNSRLMLELCKDDVDDLRFVKVDVLGLGMLSAISGSLKLLRDAGVQVELSEIKATDEKVYKILSQGRTVGIFQVESRAQQSMITKLKPESFYDLVIEVAIVRPGPIVGEVVHPYLRRRQGIEKVEFPDEKVRNILGKTLGVPLFQEQALRLAKELANFSDRELEQLRRSLRSFRPSDEILNRFKEELGRRLVEAGYSSEFANLCVSQIKGFSQYGFPESHAASFAKLVYISAWLKTFYPAFFYAGLLNAQPAGFYNPRQLIADAKNFGVEVHGHDINVSFWESRAVDNSLFLGFNLIKNVSPYDAEQIIKERSVSPFKSFQDFEGRVRISSKAVTALIEAGCFDNIEPNRKRLIFKYFASVEPNFNVDFSESDELFYDSVTKSFSTKYGYVDRIKKMLNIEALTYTELMQQRPKKGSFVKVFGIASIKQKPPTAKGVCFICLEDDSGFINVVVYPDLFRKKAETLISCDLLLCAGVLQDYVADLIPYVRATDLVEVLTTDEC